MFTTAPALDALLRGSILTVLALIWVLVLARVVGLRSFTKMTAFDFVATVATGSLLANAASATSWPAFAQPMCAVLALFATQFSLAWARQRSDLVRRIVDNRPRLLMRRGEIDRSALRDTRVDYQDILAKLREANALDRTQVHAVVLEATGDISVLHGEETTVDDELLSGVA